LKVAYLLQQFPILSQTFVIGEILDHIDAGLEVDVVSLSRPGTADEDLAALGPRMRARVTYLDEGMGKAERLFRLGAAAMGDLGRGSRGLHAARAHKGSLRDRVLTYEKVRLWPSALRGHDILHCHFGNVGRVGSVLKAAGLFDGKLVTAFHGADLSKTRYGDLGERYRQLFATGDGFLPISRHWADLLCNLGCPSDRIHIQRMGIDAAALGRPRGHAAGSQEVRLCGIGRFVEKKGHVYTVRAMAAARKLRPDLKITLDLGGDGPMLYEVVTEATALGLRDAITFHGAVSHEKALEMMGSADIFVLPSVTAADGDKEGIPVVLMEAMAMGLPVISTRHSGIPELVDDLENGLLVNERDVGGLAWAIVGLAERPESWPTLGHAAQAKVGREYDRRKLGVELRQHYQSLLA
jgi:colanic acid/amylovoran biosynthesis glycosyltransferase